MDRPVQSMDDAIAAFHDIHEREHSYRRDDAPVEVYRVTLTAVGLIDKPDLPQHELRPGRAEPVSRRRVVFDDGAVVEDTPIYARSDLGAGTSLEGPAIIEQLDSTIVVPPGTVAEADEWLNLRINVER
jgi:N-methylhydantoinase A